MWLERPYEGQFSALGPAIGPPSSLWSNPPAAEPVAAAQVASPEMSELASARSSFHLESPGPSRLGSSGPRLTAHSQHSMLNPQSQGGISSFAQSNPKTFTSGNPTRDQGRKLLCSNIPVQYLDFFRHVVALFGEADIEELGTNPASQAGNSLHPLAGLTGSALVTFLNEQCTAQFASQLPSYHQAFQGVLIKAVPLENIGVALDFPTDTGITPQKVSQRLNQFGPIGKLTFERISLHNMRAVCTFFDANHARAAAKSFMSIDGQLFQPRMVRFPDASVSSASSTSSPAPLSKSPSGVGLSAFDAPELKGSQESLFPFSGTRPYFVPRGTGSDPNASGSPGLITPKTAGGATKSGLASLTISQPSLPLTPASTPQQLSKHMSPLANGSLQQQQQQQQHHQQQQQHQHHSHHYQSTATPKLEKSHHGASAGSRTKEGHGGSGSGSGKASNSVDVDAIYAGQEKRTTIMLRNIPNKVDLKTLKKFLDETNRGTYDFLYLRIDFSNKCNVGYAFMSFISPEHLAHFVEARRGRKWEKYSSDKVIDMSFANCQGRENLIAKFRNSPVMHADPAYRPKLYYTQGARAGEEEAFPPPDQGVSNANN